MKNVMRILSGTLCATMLFGSVPVFAETTSITEAKAKDAAWMQVPNSCTYLTTDLERYWYEIKYFDVTNQEKHVVQVGKSTGNILEHTMETALSPGNTVAISKEQAEQSIRELHKDILSANAQLMQQDSKSWYLIDYRAGTKRGEAVMDAETGTILSWRETYLSEKDQELNGNVKTTNTGNTTSLVWENSIQQAVEQQIPGCIIDKITLTGNGSVYDVKVHKGDYEFDMLFHAQTGARIALSSNYDPTDFSNEWYQKPGTVKKPAGANGMAEIRTEQSQLPTSQYIGKKLAGLDISSEKISGTAGTSNKTTATSSGVKDTTTDYISRDRAKQIAQHMAPTGALLKSMSTKTSNGRTYYQGWLKKDGLRYGFQIDVYSGEVIGSSIEEDPTWDSTAHHDVESLRDEDKDYEMKWLDS